MVALPKDRDCFRFFILGTGRLRRSQLDPCRSWDAVNGVRLKLAPSNHLMRPSDASVARAPSFFNGNRFFRHLSMVHWRALNLHKMCAHDDLLTSSSSTLTPCSKKSTSFWFKSAFYAPHTYRRALSAR